MGAPYGNIRLPPAHDVRMRGFTERVTVDAALTWLDAQLRPLESERVPLREAADRVVAAKVVADVDVPSFARAMMDGFAVRAGDIEGATPYNMLALTIVGESLPGRPWNGVLTSGNAVRIMTGAPMPIGATAVLPAEFASFEESASQTKSTARSKTVLALADLPAGKHVGWPGEDITRGTVVVEEGRRLRPQDVGVLSSVGVAQVDVIRRPRVRLIITGNELLPAGEQPRDQLIADANGPMLEALIRRDGGIADFPELVPDRAADIEAALSSQADIYIVSGGSSVGQEDFAPVVVAKRGTLAIHGIAMRPSSPTGMGLLEDKLVFLLPGNPVSCLCAYDFFAGRAVRALGGRRLEWPYQQTTVRL